MIKIERAERLKQLPPYLFAELDRKKDAVKARGVDVIDVGVGDPDHRRAGAAGERRGQYDCAVQCVPRRLGHHWRLHTPAVPECGRRRPGPSSPYLRRPKRKCPVCGECQDPKLALRMTKYSRLTAPSSLKSSSLQAAPEAVPKLALRITKSARSTSPSLSASPGT